MARGFDVVGDEHVRHTQLTLQLVQKLQHTFSDHVTQRRRHLVTDYQLGFCC